MLFLPSATRVAAIAVAFAAVAASTNLTTTEVLAQMPACAQTCVLSAVLNSTCPTTNQTCVCLNAELQAAATACITSSCTIKEGLTTMNITQTACGNPVRDARRSYVILNDTFGVVIALSVFQRIVGKLYWKIGLYADDWCILVTMILFTIPSLVLNDHGLVANGMGLDIWTVPFDNITRFGAFFHAISVLYFTQISMIKLSALFFYLRVFGVSSARYFIIGTMIFNCAYGLIYAMTTIFQCLPVGYLAVKWDGEHEGRCLNIQAMTWSNASISIAVDIWMLCLPLLQIKSLQLNVKKKMGAAIMFVAGTAFTIISIIRLRTLIKFGYTDNPTWTYIEVSTWSTTEIAVGMICVCMPSYRLLAVKLFSKRDDTTLKYTPNQDSNYSGSYVKSGRKLTSNRTFDNFSQIESVSDKRSESRDADSTRTYAIGMDDLDNHNHDTDVEDRAVLVHMTHVNTTSQTAVLS
ncbi:hypothetical protein BX600DRAFT_155816 [Xylariales sp. PMI_506]|nr:hypothetical protein BX600DRAFT_155816 [Xylariales sp. PMI_506]